MIATYINAAAVIVGALIGLLLRRVISDRFRDVVTSGIGVITLVLGFRLGFESQQIVYLALSVAIGGLLGEWWKIEQGVTGLGAALHRLLWRRETAAAAAADSRRGFAVAFLNASVLFCVGAMTLVGSFRAGVEGDYELLLTKSVLDGFMAVLLTAAMGIGVAFASLVILVYQGGLDAAQPRPAAAGLRRADGGAERRGRGADRDDRDQPARAYGSSRPPTSCPRSRSWSR